MGTDGELASTSRSIDAPPPLELPVEFFTQLAKGNGCADVVRYLWRSQFGRRKILLATAYVMLRDKPWIIAPLPPVDASWTALEKAQDARPEMVTSLLCNPQVGNWLAYVLRLRWGKVNSDAPSFVDFGAFHTVAVTAAAMVGHSLITQVPLRDGRVMIPCFGMATFPGCDRWDVAEACVADGRIRLRHGDNVVEVPSTPGTDADGWWALREITVGTEPRLRLWIDDLDPMRDLAEPIEPCRLSEEDLQHWASLLGGAWSILCAQDVGLAEAMSAGLISLSPLPRNEVFGTRSASAGEAFGAMACSLPANPPALAEALVHEFMHMKLGALMHLLTVAKDGECELYAPWRDDPRPINGLLQGTYANLGITRFWWRHRRTVTDNARQLAHFEYWLARTRLRIGLRGTHGGVELHQSGREFIEALADEAESWCGDTVPYEVAELVRLLTAGHRIGWLLRNCQPQAKDIDALVAAWGSVPAMPIVIEPSSIRDDPQPKRWSHSWVGLARRLIEAPHRLEEAFSEPWGSDLTVCEVALFSGANRHAQTMCLLRLEQDPDDVAAWTVLCTAVAMDSPQCAENALIVTRPEVVRALYRRLPPKTRPTPLEVASWITAVAMVVEPSTYRL